MQFCNSKNAHDELNSLLCARERSQLCFISFSSEILIADPDLSSLCCYLNKVKYNILREKRMFFF